MAKKRKHLRKPTKRVSQIRKTVGYASNPGRKKKGKRKR